MNYESDVKKKWHYVTEDEWIEFVRQHESEEFKEKSQKNKDLRARKKLKHRLGSRAYFKKISQWDVQEERVHAVGKPVPFENITERRGRHFIRGNTKVNKEIGEVIIDTRELQWK